MEEIRLGIVGVGGRGYGLLTQVLLKDFKDVKYVAVCDLYEDRGERAADAIVEAGQPRPAVYTDYKQCIDDPNVNTVMVSTAWEDHVEVSIYAMKAGKPVGCEVGGAYSERQCWRLIETYEETKTPISFLENCLYGRRELMMLHMKEQGLLGEVIHCTGGYQHDLRREIADGIENRHYRLRNYAARNCDNYPTHDIGPIARILDINHGNRMLTLTAMSSKASGMQEYVKSRKPEDENLVGKEFAQGDVVTTMIKCARGETITLVLETTLPRFYSRNFTVHGTKAMYEEMSDSLFIYDEHDKFHEKWKDHRGNAVEYEEKYDHPIWKKMMSEGGIRGSHGGMDVLVFEDFFNCVLEGRPTPVDVYDMATWMIISKLTEDSIAQGGAPVSFPDFTNGKWLKDRATQR